MKVLILIQEINEALRQDQMWSNCAYERTEEALKKALEHVQGIDKSYLGVPKGIGSHISANKPGGSN